MNRSRLSWLWFALVWFAFTPASAQQEPFTRVEAMILTFRTGANEWIRHDAWPPKQNVVDRKLYLQKDKGLSFDPPQDQASFDSYTSDPSNPVPYRPRPIRLRTGWTTWLVEDQRFVDHRPDVLSFVSEPLPEDVVVSGRIVANLVASTTGTDSDWIVKLIDVYPDKYEPDPEMGGFQLMIAGDVFRGRYLKSFERPQPVPAHTVQHYQISFPANDHAFLKGHRIMVQVQSTWFPVIDRNPQRFVSNIFLARDSDFQTAIQRVYRSGRYASHIAVPVVALTKKEEPRRYFRLPIASTLRFTSSQFTFCMKASTYLAAAAP